MLSPNCLPDLSVMGIYLSDPAALTKAKPFDDFPRVIDPLVSVSTTGFPMTLSASKSSLKLVSALYKLSPFG